MGRLEPTRPPGYATDYRYTEVIETYIKNDYARAILNEELDVNSITWTLPHFPMYHPKKDKVHIVFDCVAKLKGFSFNDMLIQGARLSLQSSWGASSVSKRTNEDLRDKSC